MKELGSLRHLALHETHLLANAIGWLIEHHFQVEKARFQVSERLAEIVDDIVKDLFRCVAHELIG